MTILSRIIAFILIVLLSPVLLIITALIFLDDGFPALYRQKRVGINNRHFTIFKFRTMRKDTPDIPTHLLSDPSSVYTKSGPLLRKLSLDELPQLINILRGEMVFIGPRPALHNQDDLVALRPEAGVHKLIPGVTGWAQVNGRDELPIPLKVKFDEFYLQNKSIKLDALIILKTFVKSINMSGVSH